MNAANVPFRLLIINDSQEEAERLTSMFQNAGKPCRPQHINSKNGFNKIIEEQSWDIAIAYSGISEPDPSYLIQTINQHNLDLPLIILSENLNEEEMETDRSVIDGMKIGACDVVKLDDDQHLLLVVNRELKNRLERKHTRSAERKVHELEQQNKALLDSSKDGILFLQDGMITYANDSFAEKIGYQTRSDIEYSPIMDMIDPKDQQKVKSELKEFSLQKQNDLESYLSFSIKGADNTYRDVKCELSIGEFEEEPCIKLTSETMTSTNDTLEAEIANIKTTDITTGLNNKVYFNNQLCKLIHDAAENEVSYSCFCIDIDQFEEKVESVVGFDGARKTLATVADFLKENCHQDDTLARIGDNTFGILSTETNFDKLVIIGNNYCKKINSHFFEIDNKTLRLTCSIGISVINEVSIDAQSVINQSNQVIEELRRSSKGKIGNGASIYKPKQKNEKVLVSSLQKAIANNDFTLLFQPIISLRGDETERYEVLLRMIDESGEEMSPDHFLKTAENMQAMTKIDRWVILEAIKHLSKHNRRTLKPQLIINISHHSLCDESLLPWMQVAFKAAKVEPGMLILQAKESDVSQHLTAAKKFIDEAASLGVVFCINQFGCALEPLLLLDHINAEHIKIDGSFSIDLTENTDSIEVMSALLKSLHDRKKITTIPFVENADILSKLWKMGAHCIQGNYLQPPSKAMDYEFSVEGTG